jgi:hypothetical protein
LQVADRCILAGGTGIKLTAFDAETRLKASASSETPLSIRHYAPRLGEHGGAIRCEAGFTESEIETLPAEGAMVEADPAESPPT